MDTESDTDKIDMFVKAGNYHAAFNIAISALNECHRNKDQEGADKFVGIIKEITRVLAREFSSKESQRPEDGD
ncbi:MAG: hypothetical protein BMS9Abin26_1746 [Gammaproteobacteria bacterium]|nr:MAG: hypothetical protein BMS9Abin26_1746 [Gammaproteobacteria bacterium]